MQQLSASGQAISVVLAIAGDDMPEAGISRGESMYVAWESATGAFCIVRWDRERWRCSCGKGECEHRLAVNEFVFQATQKQKH